LAATEGDDSDGVTAVHLYAQIYTPGSRGGEAFPFCCSGLLTGTGPPQCGAHRNRASGIDLPMATSSFHRTFRGRFKSEGASSSCFASPRDPKDKTAIDESTDHLRLDRLAAQECAEQQTGASGWPGTSYGRVAHGDGHARSASRAKGGSRAKRLPPTCGLAMTFHHNGAFRLSYGFEYAYMMGILEGDHRRLDGLSIASNAL